MFAFITAIAPAQTATALVNSQSVVGDLTIGEIKTYKLLLDMNVTAATGG